MKRRGQATIIECIVALTIVLASYYFLYQAQNYVAMVGHMRPDPSFAQKLLYQIDNPRLARDLANGNFEPLIFTLKAEIERPKHIEILDEKGNVLFSYTDPEFDELYSEEVSHAYRYMNKITIVIVKIS